MIPLKDENPTELTPYVTVALIALNVIAWVYLESAGTRPDALAAAVCRYGMIPAELTGAGGAGRVLLGRGLACSFGGLTWATLWTSMFMHGSWLHLLGNMWFLWVFGNNIEDSMGHGRFLVFYMLMGTVAAVAQLLSNPASPVPTVGASGAISGVMGAYLLLYPKVRVKTLFIIVIFVTILYVPAWFILLEWFALQLLEKALTPPSVASVAYWAHIGGFVAGLLTISLFRNPDLVRARRSRGRADRSDLPDGGWL